MTIGAKMGAQGHVKILIVEDDPGIARLEQLELERAGYSVLAAATASEALDLVATGGIELILLDQQLPSGQSGLALFRQIKDAGHDVPAILVTGLQDENLLVEALRSGVRDFVPKTPNFLNHLEPIVSRVIRQVRTERDLAESRVTAQEHQARRRELEHEIAQRKRVEQALRVAEENLRLMVESIKDFAIFTVDKEARVVSWNSGAQQLFGYTEDEVLGQSIVVIFPPEDRAALVPAQELASAAATGRATDERWHIRKDGSRFFASGVLAPIFDEESKLRGFTKICRDITARKEAEIAVREAAVRLKAIVDTAVDGIITIDENGIVESMNLAAERLFGFGRDEVIGSNVKMLMPEPYRAEHDGYLVAYLTTGQKRIIGSGREVIGRRKDGSTFPMELAVSETRLGLRRIFTGIVRDITERKRLEDELRGADERKNHFLAMLAHELRNPLAPISNAVQIMRIEGPSGPNHDWSIDVIAEQIKQMTRIVDDLLDLSRINRGKVSLQREPVELAQVIELAVQASRPQLDEYRHELYVSLPEGSIVLDVDRARFAQVLSNLLNNSAKYTPEGGRIDLTVTEAGSDVLIKVADNGIGISQDLLPKVFDLFVQADQSLSRSRGGLGIGLTVVRSLVELHEGSVSVKSDGPGMGSEFTIRVPRPQAPSVMSSAETGKTGRGPSVQVPRRRILVVDDSLLNAASLEKLLIALGQEVRTAHDGEKALEMARAFLPDVMLLDIGLPVVDGYEVARLCRLEPRLQKTILVAMTGYGKAEDKQRSQVAGFNAHLVKPVVVEDLELLLQHSSLNSS
jgi:PAS domain S-box-containing protein